MNVNSNASMHRPSMGPALAAALLLLCASGSALAASTTLEGKGTYVVHRALMPLADGGAVVHTTASTVASANTTAGGVMFGECAGLAHLSAEGEAKSRVYCNFSQGGEDRFVMEADMGLEGGEIRIIGGSGKWKGATGAGMLKRTGENGGTGTYDYKFDITTP